MNVLHRIVFGAALVLVLAGCDPAAPLFLRNGLSTPITVRASFSGAGGAPSEGTLQPGERLAFIHPQGDIERVTVLVDDKAIHDLDKAALEKMRDSVDNPRDVTWDIEPGRIKPLNRAEWEQLRKN